MPAHERERDATSRWVAHLLLASREARRKFGELVAVADDLGALQIRGSRVLVSSLLCRHRREEGHAPSFARHGGR